MGSWSIYFDNADQVREFLDRHSHEFTTKWESGYLNLVSVSTGELMGELRVHNSDAGFSGEAHWID